ncbi:MAG: hypothetical protein L0387_45900 [Acidobacteria bacterium]|nr:hypothetical protein [Acidobacteriota bacterium]MCI0720650.1 hypothetical protein [Acidobacteriota bacterium]
MKKPPPFQDLPEKLHDTKYYEHDGLLRAYANRTMVLAMMFGVIALGSLSFAIYVRLQPPTVVRVEPNGEASAVRTASNADPNNAKLSFHVAAANETEPTELEARACVRRFLEAYLNYSPGIAEHRFAEALNMMTGNLRSYTMTKLRDDDVVGKIKEESMVSTFKIRSIEPVKGSPYSFMAFGVRELRQVKNGRETTDRIVSRYTLRLAVTKRTEFNPSGLLIAEYWEQQILGDRESGTPRG